MKLQELTIKNVKSFRDKQTIKFKNSINIFIGANASGKSNLMEIIHVLISYYFVYPWRPKILVEQELPSSDVVDNIYNGRKDFEPIEYLLDKNNLAKDKEQSIKISLSVTKRDVESLKVIQKHKIALEKVERLRFSSSYLKKLQLDEINVKSLKNKKFKYTIINNKPIADADQDNANLFLSYLNNHELIRFCVDSYNEKVIKKYKIENIPPIFESFCSFRDSMSLDIKNIIELSNRVNLLQGFNKKPVIFSSEEQDEVDPVYEKEEKRLLESVIKKLGYRSVCLDWSKKKKEYKFSLKKNTQQKYFSNASSGEQKILKFLFSAISGNFGGGIVLVSEPEIYLYPQRQKILLDLFQHLAKLLDLQFVIVTHSPWMIDGASVDDSFRVYKKEETSKIYSPSVKFLKEDDEKDLVLIINALNNEKMFFSEKVVLVEGIADRIIFETILHDLQKKNDNFESIEIIDVFGKGNLHRFKNFLAQWQIKSYIIADDDYVYDLLRGRKRKIEKNKFIASLRNEGIYVLPKGDLEDYFHEGHFNIDEAINIAQQIKHGNRTIPKEFEQIFEEIISN